MLIMSYIWVCRVVFFSSGTFLDVQIEVKEQPPGGGLRDVPILT